MNFIKSILKNTGNKKIIKYAFIFFVVYYLSSDFASANFNDIKESTQTIGEGLLKGISVILALFTYLATIFLSPTWLNGSLFGLNTYFKDIWILVSNIVYFIFAFVLIWIAFMNIIGKTSDQYQLKQALPKFIVGVLIVPFSWFIIQFILSLSAILTVAGLSLPFDTFDDFSSSLNKVNIPKNCTLDLQSFLDKDSSESIDPDKKTTESVDPNKKTGDGFIYCTEGSGSTIPLTEISSSGDSNDSIFGIISMYTYGILSLDTVDDIDAFDLNSVKTMGDLVVKIVFDLLFVFIYSILMIALGVVLMIRGIYIWIYIMISPVFGLMYFFDKKTDGFFAKFNIKEFIALAMVPVYTMLALSFGLLFIYVVGNGIGGGTQSGILGADKLSIEDNGVNVGQFKLTILGQVSKVDNTTNFLKEVGGTGLGIIGSLILKVFGIVILWGAVMAAMRTSEITKAITEPLQSFGKQVGGILTSAPTNIPIFPTGKGGMQSMNSLSQASNTLNSSITGRSAERANRLSANLPFGNDEVTANLNKRKVESVGANTDTQRATILKGLLKDVNGDAEKLHNNNISRDTLYDLAKKILGSTELDKIVKSSGEIKNLDIVAKIYDEIERKGGSPAYNDLLPGGVGGISKGTIKNTVRDYKNGINSNMDSSNSGSNNSSSNVNFKINVSGVLEGLNQDVQLQKLPNNKYNTDTSNHGYLAENIQKLKNNGIFDMLDDTTLKKDLLKYFDANGQFVSGGAQTGGKFPWETTPNP